MALVDDAGPSMEDSTALVPVYNPHILIQSPTTDWVTRRGLADRTIWTAIAASARKICAEMIQVDELNARLETGKLLIQGERKDIMVIYIIRSMIIRVCRQWGIIHFR